MASRYYTLAVGLLLGVTQVAWADCEPVPDALFEQFDQVDYCLTSGLVAVKQGKRWGYVDSDGVLKVPFIYDEAQTFNDAGFAVVGLKQKYGLIDKQGKLAVALEYDLIDEPSENLMPVSLANKNGFMDSR